MNFLTLPFIFLSSFLLTRYLCSASASTSHTLLDHPNERSLHSKPTPRTGGIGILGGFFGGILLFPSSSILRDNHGQLIWLLSIAGIIAIFSFWDDRTPLPAILRLTIQFILAVLFIRMTSLTISSVSIPLVGPIYFGILSTPLTLALIIWMTNLYNFMDGMDGFAGGMTVIGCFFLGLLALMHNEMSIAWIAFLLMAATGGFLIENFPPARIFMGDVGSISLGFMIGALMVVSVSNNSQLDLWEPILIFSPFIMDATLTLARRLFKKQKIWLAHRDHYYQKVVLSGWGHRKTVLTEYGLMTVCGLGALLYSKLTDSGRLTLLLLWGTFYASMALTVTMMEKNREKRLNI